MTNGMIVKEQSDSTNNLRSIFDQSLAILCDVKGSLKTETRAGRLRMGSFPLHIDAISLQKRALNGAAKALTALWKISKARTVKLQNRNMQYSRSTS